MSHQSPFKWRHARIRDHFAVRAAVLALLSELSRPRRDDAGTGWQVDHTMISRCGKPLRSRARQALSTAPQSHH